LTINGAFRSSDGGMVVFGSGRFREDPTPRRLGKRLPKYLETLQLLQPSYVTPGYGAAGIVKFDSTGIVEWSIRWPGQLRNAFEYRSRAGEPFVILNISDPNAIFKELYANLVAVGLHDGLITTEYEVMMLHKEKSIPYITPSLDGRLLQFEIRCDQHYDSSDVTISYYNGDVTQSGMRNQGAPLLKASPDLIHVPSDSAIAQIEERYRIPNPFGAINLPYAFTSSIAYLLRRRTTVCMTLCNNGEVLDTLAAGCREAGAWSFVWQPNEKDQFGSFQIRFEDGEGNKDSCRVEVR